MRIAVLSGKGGVGKTFISVNLATLLAKAGYRTLLVDANFTAPTVAAYLKVDIGKHTLDSDADPVWVHPEGFHFVAPSYNLVDIDDEDVIPLMDKITRIGKNYDFVIYDGPAGVGKDVYHIVKRGEAAALVVAVPTYASLYNALKVIYFVHALGGILWGPVLNMWGPDREVEREEAEEILESKVLGVIPYDKNVVRAFEEGRPLVSYAPSSPAAVELIKIVKKGLGIDVRIRRGLFDWIRSLLGL